MNHRAGHVLSWLYVTPAVVLLALMFRPVIEGDGVGYYSYLHAVLVSHSLSFANEYSAAISAHVPTYLAWLHPRPGGQLIDYFPVGTAILSLPFYLVALGIHPEGEPQYGWPFVEAFTLASLLCSVTALALCYRFAVRLLGSARPALLGVLAGLFATPFLYYAFSEPSYSHTFSVFTVSVFLYLWWTRPDRGLAGWFWLGIVGGLMATVRLQDGLLVGIVLVDWKTFRWSSLAFPVGALIGFLPQLAVDFAEFGGPLPERPPGQALTLMSGHYIDVLFSSYQGLLVWTPIAVVAAVGVVLIQDKRLQVACTIAFVIELIINGAAPDSVGLAFGQRRFLDLVPFAVPAIATAAQRVGPRLDWAVIGVFCMWNLLLIANFEYVMKPGADPGYAGLLTGQIHAISSVPRLFTKGGVIRNLVLFNHIGSRFDAVAGLTLLFGEIACVGAGLAVALIPRRMMQQRNTS